MSDAIDTPATRSGYGKRTTMASGSAAPAAKVVAEVRTACIGRAAVTSEIPSPSRAWAAFVGALVLLGIVNMVQRKNIR